MVHRGTGLRSALGLGFNGHENWSCFRPATSPRRYSLWYSRRDHVIYFSPNWETPSAFGERMEAGGPLWLS